MAMTTENTRMMIYLSGSGDAVINWGDGTVEQEMLLEYDKERKGDDFSFIHDYRENSAHTIKITGENITHLFCLGMELTGLDVRKDKSLATLDCSINELTSLDVSNNPVLKELHYDEDRVKLIR